MGKDQRTLLKLSRYLLLMAMTLVGIFFIVASGGGGGDGDDISGTPDDTTAPSTPAGLTAEADSATTILLGWDAATDNVGVAGYLIYRDGSQIQDLYSPAGLVFDDTELSPETTYSYRVSAYDSAGNESARSAEAEATTLPIQVVQFGTSGDDFGSGVGLDATGDVYVAGSTKGTLDAPAIGGQDAFVRKFNSDKETQWTVQFGTTDMDEVNAVAVDPDGNSYVAGSTEGILKYSSILKDAFLVKYDPAGDEVWVNQVYSQYSEEGFAVAVDYSNSCVYLAGMTSGDIYGFTNAGTLGAFDLFLAKYDLDGAEEWKTQTGIVGNDIAYGVAVDGSGNVYITGQTNGDLDPNDDDSSHHGGPDAFLIKFDSSGTRLWTRQWGTSDFDYGNGVAVDSHGYIYVAGITYGALDGANAGDRDVFLVKYDADGNQQWIRQTGSSNEDHSRAISVNSSDDIYITGMTRGIISDINEGGTDIFLVVYDDEGNLLGETQGGSSGEDEAGGIAIDSVNSCFYITGQTSGGVDGNTNIGGWDALLIKMSFEGDLL
ncbi:MAG: SBBP repeat-containing protein [Deltaproteobacteria bacterium]|nr:SBBP repeat-containing protein [Deltaproteobacteria bacterium]